MLFRPVFSNDAICKLLSLINVALQKAASNKSAISKSLDILKVQLRISKKNCVFLVIHLSVTFLYKNKTKIEKSGRQILELRLATRFWRKKIYWGVNGLNLLESCGPHLPTDEVVGAVLAGAPLAVVFSNAVAHLLEVFVEHGVAQIVAHFAHFGHRVGDGAVDALFFGPLYSPIGCLDGTGVRIRGSRVLPLGSVAVVSDEKIQETVLENI